MQPDAKFHPSPVWGKSPLNVEVLHGHVFERKTTQTVILGLENKREEGWFLICPSRAFEEELSWKGSICADEKPPICSGSQLSSPGAATHTSVAADPPFQAASPRGALQRSLHFLSFVPFSPCKPFLPSCWEVLGPSSEPLSSFSPMEPPALCSALLRNFPRAAVKTRYIFIVRRVELALADSLRLGGTSHSPKMRRRWFLCGFAGSLLQS